MKQMASIAALAVCIIAASCGSSTGRADAWGNFEVTETVVSAETAGRLIFIDAPEGSVVQKGSVIAITDTTALNLQRAELAASMASVSARVNAYRAQNEIIRQQIANLDVNIDRTGKMLGDQAATQKQLDDLTGQRAVFERQIKANDAQALAVAAELRVLTARLDQLSQQIARCTVGAPVTGTILARYAEYGEITAPARPLVKIAPLDTMILRVYVSGAQLGLVRPGEKCTVRADEGAGDYRTYTGTITTVSPKAEFTPKIIQTKEERVTLVYAVTIEVPNDGFLRNGMPGEAIFTTTAAK